MVKLISRSDLGWGRTGASYAYVRSGVALHYNGGPTGNASSHSKCVSYWKSIRRYHINGNGWADIGYAWGVCPHGYTFEGRGFDRRQAAQPGGNTTHQSISLMIGGSERPTSTQIAAIKETIAWLRSRGVGNQIKGHRDFYNTSCPGNIIYNMMRNGAFTPGGSYTPPSGGGGTGVRSVESIQRAVNSLGYEPPLAVDGDWGPLTEEGVRWLQAKVGTTVDGDWGPLTEAAYLEYIKDDKEPKDLWEMSEFVYYTGQKDQIVRPHQTNYVEFDHSNASDNPVVTFAFQNREVVGTVWFDVTGEPGHGFGIRVVKDKPKDGGGFETVHRFDDHQFYIPDRGYIRQSFGINERTFDDERMRVTIYPLHSELRINRVAVRTRQWDS